MGACGVFFGRLQTHFTQAHFSLSLGMARIELQIPEHLPFECRIPIRITDLNYGNHLANDKVLSIIHEARVQFFNHFGYSEIHAEGTSFIMGDCAIGYKNEGFYGQTLRVQVGAGDYTRVAFDIYYRLYIEETGQLLAEAKTGLVCFNYDNRKVQRVPEALKATLGDVLVPLGQ